MRLAAQVVGGQQATRHDTIARASGVHNASRWRLPIPLPPLMPASLPIPLTCPPACLPALQDLRTIQQYQQKVSGYSAAPSARQSTAYPPASGPGGPGGLSRASTGGRDDLIKAAVYPLADSLPGSARSTPREMGGSDGPPAGAAQYAQQCTAAQQQQQYGVGPLSRAPSSAALHQQPQQQQAQYQQAAAQQQHQGGVAHAPLLREGSLRGGLANLAGKVLNSPIDRLRRLSSGH